MGTRNIKYTPVRGTHDEWARESSYLSTGILPPGEHGPSPPVDVSESLWSDVSFVDHLPWDYLSRSRISSWGVVSVAQLARNARSCINMFPMEGHR